MSGSTGGGSTTAGAAWLLSVCSLHSSSVASLFGGSGFELGEKRAKAELWD